MPATNCGHCHRTGKSLIHIDEFEFCAACGDVHEYRSHGHKHGENNPCPNVATRLESVSLATPAINGKFFVCLNFKDGHEKQMTVSLRRWQSLIKMLARDHTITTWAQKQSGMFLVSVVSYI